MSETPAKAGGVPQSETAQSAVRSNVKVRASELAGRGWLNTGGEELNLDKLRGKIVLLDFWTFCCINCLHVLDELRELEDKYRDVLVIVGVHSPKFEHEADPEALAAAVDRYEIHHPVLDDPELSTWQAYAARAWPTLVVVDPEGNIAAHLSGEGHAAGLDALVQELIAEHEAVGTLHRGDGPYKAPEPRSDVLRFPGKAIAVPGGFLVADSGHHQIVLLDQDCETELARFGSGERGYTDGPGLAVAPAHEILGQDAQPSQPTRQLAQFNEPQGLALLPEELRERLGYDVVIADTVNHRLRSLRLADGAVGTLAGNGVQRLLEAGEGAHELDRAATEVSLSSPWDVVYEPRRGQVVIAMAGTHQIFGFDPVTGRVSVVAGTGLEGLQDGDAAEAWFAQPSGLAVDGEGTIWVADSETSALRAITLDGAVHTHVGTGLFDFGHRDGDADQARLQHPLGVAVLPDGSVALADTFNGAIRRYSPQTREVSTLATGLLEPSDVLVEFAPTASGSAAAGEDNGPAGAAGDGAGRDREQQDAGEARLVVVETNRHQLARVPIPKTAQAVDRGARQTNRPATALAPGELALAVRFSAPSGQKLDDRWGDPTQLKVSSTPEEFLLGGAGTTEGLERTLHLNPEVPDGVLHITARAAACDGEPGGEIPLHAACHLYQQDWGIPVTLREGGDSALTLDLRGTN